MRNFIVYLLLFFVSLTAFAQQPQQMQKEQNKNQLAARYYRDREFEKARDMYLDLYESTNMGLYFDYYVNCLVFLKDYDNAVKELKKQIRKTKTINLEITLGYVYKEMGEEQKASETFNDIIDHLSASKGVIISVGNAFFGRREFEYAIKTYMKGREILPGEMFYSNLASIYAFERDYKQMMEAYLALIKEDEKQLALAQASINSLLRYDFDNSMRQTVKTEIIKVIQAFPEIIAYNRLLIWMFTIEKNYEQALNNSIALDKRTKTEEQNILSFSKGAGHSGLYDVALKGLNYLLTRIPPVDNSGEVKKEMVNVEYLRYINLPPNQRQSGDYMIARFEQTLNEVGYSNETTDLILKYAHLLSFYLGQPDKAFDVLNKAMNIKGLNNNERTLFRIELADTYVYDNKLWEAALLYAQIVEANKENPLGDEAKLKKAKLSYYIGDIEWANVQFDVLKASTSKLIANDAMEMSLLISANYDLDTTVAPIQQFARGDLLLFQNKDSLAFITFDSVAVNYPINSLNDKILMRKAAISEKRFEFETASAIYQTVVKKFPASTSADEALFRQAVIFENKLNDTTKAQALFKQILIDYPGSIYVADARNRFRNLRGDKQNEEEKLPYEDQFFNGF